jgi:hypothetical protein
VPSNALCAITSMGSSSGADIANKADFFTIALPDVF